MNNNNRVTREVKEMLFSEGGKGTILSMPSLNQNESIPLNNPPYSTLSRSPASFSLCKKYLGNLYAHARNL